MVLRPAAPKQQTMMITLDQSQPYRRRSAFGGNLNANVLVMKSAEQGM